MAQSPGDTLELDRGDDLPVGVHLAWRLRALILSGRLPAGERLPGVRELGAGTAVNTNTARAVYRRLEEEGLVTSRQGQGTFVADGVAGSPEVEELAARAARAAVEQGIDPRDLARILYAGSAVEPGEASAVPGIAIESDEADELAVRRTLRRQIAHLEWQLASHPEHRADAEAPYPREPVGRLVGLEELERLRDDLVRRLRKADAAAEDRGEREGAARERLEAMIEEPAAHKWDVVTDADLGEPGCRTYEVQPALGPIGALMNWWQVKVSGGCPLPGPREARSVGKSRRR
jgi:DNA-binding transcriptional regulator YhcF (GntR family)